MVKFPEDKLNELLCNIVSNNPYIDQSAIIYKGDELMYNYYGEEFSKENLDARYRNIAEMDLRAGFKERMLGYYDKYYRYNRSDEGFAYDTGVKLALSYSDCPCECHIIK